MEVCAGSSVEAGILVRIFTQTPYRPAKILGLQRSVLVCGLTVAATLMRDGNEGR